MLVAATTPASAQNRAAIPAAASPAPCPSASPRGGAGPSPAPCASPELKTTGTTVGRNANLVGKAMTASEGTISQEQIQTRPILRPGEVLEAIPGLVIS